MREHAKDPWSVGTAIIDGDPVTAIFDRNSDEICNMGNSLLDEDANACRIDAMRIAGMAEQRLAALAAGPRPAGAQTLNPEDVRQ